MNPIDPGQLKSSMTFINLWGWYIIILAILFGGIGLAMHYWMTRNLIFGRNASVPRFLVPIVFTLIGAAIVPILLVQYYLPLADALSSYNAIRRPPLELAGKLLMLIFDPSKNETDVGKWLLAGINGVIGIGSEGLLGVAVMMLGKLLSSRKGGQ